MSCKYCKEASEVIFKRATLSESSWGWGTDDTKINLKEASTYPLAVFIDRGCLRLCDLEDCSCMDHGEAVEIKYCPFCGDELKYELGIRVES